MKISKFGHLALLLASLLVCAEVGAQISTKQDAIELTTGQIFSLDHCAIHINPHKGAYFQFEIEDEDDQGIQEATYLYPLGKIIVPDHLVSNSVYMRLYCSINASRTPLDYYADKMGKTGIESRQISGDNWKGTLIVSRTIGNRPPTVPYENYVFCIKDNTASQHLCGHGSADVDYDLLMRKLIEALKAIKFVHIVKKIPPSFDCKRAKSFAEKTICADVKLSLFDRTLSENYKRIRSATPYSIGKAQLLAEQREWIKYRDACKTISCLFKSYIQRITYLCGYGSDGDEKSSCVTVSGVIKAASSD